MSLLHKASTVFPDIEKITDPEIKRVFSDLFKVLQTSLVDIFDDSTAEARWKVDGTETQLETADEIDMQSKNIINVTDPTAAQDAATKAYADSVAKWEVDGTETQLKTADEIDMRSKNIINVTDPVSAQDAATKNYADGKISKTTAGEISVMTEKVTLADDDLFLIEDSAASNAKKKAKRSSISSLQDSSFLVRATSTTAFDETDGYDTNGDFASNTFTAPVAGRYLFIAVGYWGTGTGQETITMASRVKRHLLSSSVETSSCVAVIVNLTASQTVTCAFTNANATLNVNDITRTYFCGALLNGS